MNLLAEISAVPGSLELGGWLLCAATFMSLSLNALKLADRIKGRDPQPPNAQLEQEHQHLNGRVVALEDRTQQVEERTQQIADSIVTQAQTEADNASERRRLIYEKIERLQVHTDKKLNRLTVAVAGLCALKGIQMPPEESD